MQPVTKDELLLIIDEIRDRVAIGDSYEGFLNYLIPANLDDPNIVADVEARFRVGNLEGQGGMKMIGVDTGPHEHDHTEAPDAAEVMQMRQALKTCQEERTYSAEYAVRAEDEASQLREELRFAVQGLNHLLHHLYSDNPTAAITTPGDECSVIHPRIKGLTT